MRMIKWSMVFIFLIISLSILYSQNAFAENTLCVVENINVDVPPNMSDKDLAKVCGVCKKKCAKTNDNIRSKSGKITCLCSSKKQKSARSYSNKAYHKAKNAVKNRVGKVKQACKTKRYLKVTYDHAERLSKAKIFIKKGKTPKGIEYKKWRIVIPESQGQKYFRHLTKACSYLGKSKNLNPYVKSTCGSLEISQKLYEAKNKGAGWKGCKVDSEFEKCKKRKYGPMKKLKNKWKTEFSKMEKAARKLDEHYRKKQSEMNKTLDKVQKSEKISPSHKKEISREAKDAISLLQKEFPSCGSSFQPTYR